MPWIVALILVVISGLVAAAGDFMGQRAARRKLRIGSLRPRYVSRLIAVLSGILISLATYGALFLLYTDYREALTNYGSVKQQFIEAVAGKERAERETRAQQQQLEQAQASLETAQQQLSESQEQQIELVKQADSKRKEVEQLSSEVKSKQAQVDSAERSLRDKNTQLANVNKQLAKAQSDLRGSQVLGAIQLDKLRRGDIILPNGAVLGRVEVKAAEVSQLSQKLQAAVENVKLRLADELKLVLDPNTNAAIQSFVDRYAYKDPAQDAVIAILAEANVVAGDAVRLSFSATAIKPLVKSGDLLLSLRIADDGARISARGLEARNLTFANGLTTDELEDTLVETGSAFVDAMLALGFIPPEGADQSDLAAAVLEVAGLGSELLSRERPYLIQLAARRDLSSTDWPREVTINVFKEPGS